MSEPALNRDQVRSQEPVRSQESPSQGPKRGGPVRGAPERGDRVERFGHFLIEGFLGRGATGDVRLAWDEAEGRPVALKLIRTGAVDPEALLAERRGARLQRALAAVTPAVAEVYEHGDCDGCFFVAMELVDGDDLGAALRSAGGRFSVPRALAIALQLCSTLELLHGFRGDLDGQRIEGVVHGDIKPQNVRLERGDRVRLLDFGIAKQLSVARTETRNVFGTYPYTPPERLRTGCVDAASDVWAVAVVLYVMVAGHPPFAGSSLENIEHAIRSLPPLPPPVDVPPSLRTLLERALAKEPVARFGTAIELGAALLNASSELSEAASLSPSAEAPRQFTRTPDVERDIARDVAQGQPSHDLGAEVTRRTAPGGGSDDATHRTAIASDLEPVGGARSDGVRGRPLTALPPVPARERGSTLEGPLAPRRNRWPSRRLRWVLGACALFMLVQACAQSSADRVVAAVRSEAAPNLDRAWGDYRFAALMRPFDLGLGPARSGLRQALLDAGDRTLHAFRVDVGLPRLEDWRRAAQSLERAQRLGDDDAVRARLLCAQAHVHRIRAQERRGGGAEEDWNDAIFGFEQAAELAPKWPDPYLGLARIYAYERFDLEGLLDALEAARARGYAWGPREVAQLADAYRRRGEELAAESRSASDVRSASRMLGQARLHLEAAVSAYDRILDFGNARRNRELAIATLDGLRRPEKRRIAGQR